MGPTNLQPLPYHLAIRDFLKGEEGRVWEWFASHKARDEQAEAVRFDLLKRTYRIERCADPQLYATADEVKNLLSLDVPITIYQAQNPEGLNAGLAYVPHEAHIVFEGPIKSRLTAPEAKSLLGHELAHFALWEGWDGEFLVADQILSALTHDAAAEPPHMASARLLGLYSEIFCDRGALAVAGDPLVVVATLVKLATGLEEVDAASYIRQAEEIFLKGPAKTAGLTHPEAYVRARAIQLWHDGAEAVEEQIAEMIEGALALDELDLLGQQRVAALTRRLIDALLRRPWMQTELLMGHARLYFPDYALPRQPDDDDGLANDLRTEDLPLRDYYCYVMLDFVTADRELEQMPLAAALQLGERLGLKDRLAEIAMKELRLTKKQLGRLDQEKTSLLEKAANAGCAE